jgi:hypothetical protein
MILIAVHDQQFGSNLRKTIAAFDKLVNLVVG